jgi:Terminase large subunit, T4likevirus-type, N-terminal
VFGGAFKNPATWAAWRAFLAALFGLPMSDAERATFTRCTGLDTPPSEPSDEAWLICGRRAGKSFVLALIAVYLAAFRDWREHLAPGERGTLMILAADRRQARTIMRYVTGLLEAVPMLAQLVQSKSQEAIELDNQISIEIHTASFRSVRGYTVCAALCDEAAFWRSDESANPDKEILAALRPAMATVKGAMLLVASSPYARRGVLWEAHKKHYGKPKGPLVWQAASRDMNPTVPQSLIDEAMADDPARARAEYGAEFRGDVETFIDLEALSACLPPAPCRERAPISNLSYRAFVDPSGGSADSFAMAIGHTEGDRQILDAIREVRPRFSPESVVEEFCTTLRDYGISKVTGDAYAGLWPREQFEKRGIEYVKADRPRSDLYLAFLPLINSASCELLSHDRLTNQLTNLERRTSRAGRDSIDHPPGANSHDDVANAVAGLMTELSRPAPEPFAWYCCEVERAAAETQPKHQPMTREFLEGIQGNITSWH